MASTPIKFLGIADSDGSDITGVGFKKAKYQELTTTEENYLAYQAGLRLSLDSDVAGLTLSSSGNASVGSHSNTSFDDAVGTHGQTLTTTTVTTPIYQKEGTASESGANFRKPVHYQKAGSQTQFHEMTSSEIDTLTDRLVSRIFTSDYPGSFKLSTSAPTGYSTYLSNVFEDTRTDGHSQHYSIYRRTSMSAPTAVKPLAIKRSLGGSGTYQGLQQMSTAQMQYTFGQRAKNRIMDGNNGVGTYLLLSSTSGTPTDNGYSGTWHSKGIAVDTKNTTGAVAYTRDFTRNRASNYARAFEGNYVGDYTRTSTRTRTSNYAREYSRSRESVYTRISTAESTRDRISTYNRTRTSNYSRNFTRSFEGNYTRNYTRDFEGNYSRDFEGNYTSVSTGNFQTDYSRAFTRDRSSAYTRISVGNYTGDYTRNFEGNYTGNYSGDKDFTRSRTSNYARAYTRISVGNYARAFTRTSSRGFARTTSSSYTGNYTGPTYFRNFTRTSTRNFGSGGTPGSYHTSSNTLFPLTEGFSYSTIAQPANTTVITVQYNHADGAGIQTVGSQTYSGTITQAIANQRTLAVTTGVYAGNTYESELNTNPSATQYVAVPGSYLRYSVRLQASGRTSTYTGNYEGVGTSGYTGNYVGDYIGAATFSSEQYSASSPRYYWETDTDVVPAAASIDVQWANVGNKRTGASNFQYSNTPNTELNMTEFDATDGYTYKKGSLEATYNGKYNTVRQYGVSRALSTSNFTGNYTRSSFRDFSADYTRNFIANYSRNYIGNYTRNYTRDSTGNYSRNFARGFTGNYTGTSNFVGDYTRTSVGNYSRGPYAGNYTGNYTRVFEGNYSRNYSRNFSRDFEGNYVSSSGSTYTRDRSSNYTREFTRDRSSNYSRNYARDFEGDYTRIFSGEFTGNFEGDYTRAFEGNYSRNFARDFAGEFTGDYTRTSLGNYSRNYSRTFVGDYQGNFVGNEIQSGTETIETYTLYVKTA